MDSELITDKSIVVFDGVCNFCNASVNFIIKNDSKDNFRFAAYQSEAGEMLSKKYNFKFDDPETIILIEGGKAYEKSTAALRIAKKLDGIYSLLYSYIFIPKGVRDYFYKFIAKNRYKWFGKKDSCMIPSKELRAKFL